MTKGRNTCVECSAPAGHDLYCDEHRAWYVDAVLYDDECPCLACRSDLKGITPCLGK